jgi:hypothetical protein
VGACPKIVELDVGANNRREIIEGTICVDDAEVVEGVPIVGLERLTERMEDSLKGVVVP